MSSLCPLSALSVRLIGESARTPAPLRAMAALKHPNIVGLKDIVYVPRSVFGGPVGAADCPKGCAFPVL